jgi:hypothetical protein
VVTTVVPDAARLDEAGWGTLEDIVEQALALRPPRLRRQLRIFLSVLQWVPLLRYGRPLSALNFTQRTRVLATMQDAPLLLLRRGFWGLRTLILMGYYARPAARAEIGYRADPRGWEARR